MDADNRKGDEEAADERESKNTVSWSEFDPFSIVPRTVVP